MMDQDALDWYARYNRYATGHERAESAMDPNVASMNSDRTTAYVASAVARFNGRLKVRAYHTLPSGFFTATLVLDDRVTVRVRSGERRDAPYLYGADAWLNAGKRWTEFREQVNAFSLADGFKVFFALDALVTGLLDEYAAQEHVEQGGHGPAPQRRGDDEAAHYRCL